MTVRDADRFKDKIEVSLDSRQIFFLFFGGALVACLVFVLGVMVGKRLEQRERVAHKATTSAAVDPLAALDELGADEATKDDLAFPTALAAAAPTPPPPPEKKAEVPPPAPAVASAPAPAPPPPAPAPEKKPDVKKPAPPAPGPDEKKPEDKKDERKRFTLQISSFQDRAEAESLVSRLSGLGYKPFIVQSTVGDKGTFYRVRIGEYPSQKDAAGAKGEFEKKQHILAYVTKI